MLTGHDFPELGSTALARRVRRCIASMLRENFDPASSVVGLEVKVLVAGVFAEIVQNEHLAAAVRALAGHAGVDSQRVSRAAAFGRGDDKVGPTDRATSVALTLARAASHTPARIDATTIAACRHAQLSAPATIEIITWLAVLQMLHRLSCFVRLAD